MRFKHAAMTPLATNVTNVALTIHIADVVVAFGRLFIYPALVSAVQRSDASALVSAARATSRRPRGHHARAAHAGLFLAAREDALGKPWVIVPMAMIATATLVLFTIYVMVVKLFT